MAAIALEINLKAVHSVIQAAMGWLNCHLWSSQLTGASTEYISRTALIGINGSPMPQRLNYPRF